MSKNHQNSPPRLYFSGALSANLTKQIRKNLLSPRFPEQCRPLSNRNRLQYSVFRSNVGQQNVKSHNFVSNQRDKELWQEQSLT